MSNWFIPGKDDFPSQRALLHLGLNKAVRYYRELVVPGIGGVWSVRQLSWATAGISVAQSPGIRHTASRVANAIEALACKLMWIDGATEGIRGIRAFTRHPDVMSFKELSQRKYYVQVTYRQSTVRALLALQLADGGDRFNSMCLTPSGEDMAGAFLDTHRLRTELDKWIHGKAFPRSGKKIAWLGRSSGSSDENSIVRDRLLAESSDTRGSTNRRRLLIEAFGNRNRVNPPGVTDVKRKLDTQQRLEVETAEAFDRMLMVARELVHQSAECLEDVSSTTAGRLAARVSKGIRALNSASGHYMKKIASSGKNHADAVCFAEAILQNKNGQAILGEVLSRDGAIVSCADKKNITKGPLFDRRQSPEMVNPGSDGDEEGDQSQGLEETSTANKIKQLFSLWRDCNDARK